MRGKPKTVEINQNWCLKSDIFSFSVDLPVLGKLVKVQLKCTETNELTTVFNAIMLLYCEV